MRVHLDPDQVETIKRMAERAGRGVSAAQVHRAAVREGLAVLDGWRWKRTPDEPRGDYLQR